MNVLVLTGAGVSAESGIPTFRDSGGLWEEFRFEDVATPEAFRRDPQLVHEFYNRRRRQLIESDIRPNAAHRALAKFERGHDGAFLLVTQNIDDLHQRAGSQNVLPMHGELLKARDEETGETFPWRGDLTLDTSHPRDPARRGKLRPHVVWFGEMPIGLPQIELAAQDADLFLAIGTSGVVYPAAGIVESTSPDCHRVEINLEETPASPGFDETIRGSAADVVPRFLETLRG